MKFELPPRPSHDRTPDQLLDAQLRFQGCTLEQLVAAELRCAREFDPDVSRADLDRIEQYRSDAQKQFRDAIDQRYDQGGKSILLAPTARVVDHTLDNQGLSILMHKICHEGLANELLVAIDKGPGGGAIIWESPQTPVELLASIVRWAIIREGDKIRIRTGPTIRNWIHSTLAEADYDTAPRLGGVSAVGAALSQALGHQPTMFALGELPLSVRQYLPSNLAVVSESPKVSTLSELSVDRESVGNFCISWTGKPLQVPPQLETVSIGGASHTLADISHLDIFVTGGSSPPGFGTISSSRMKKLGAAHDLMILSGLQSLCTTEQIDQFLAQVKNVHSAECSVAALYSSSKFPEREVYVWKAIREAHCIDFLGLNSVEAFDVLERIRQSAVGDNPLELDSDLLDRIDTALRRGHDIDTLWDNGRESPEWAVESARLIQEITRIPLIRVRGRPIDVLICADGVQISNPAKVRNSLLISRDLGTLKVANPTGIIDERHEIGALRNVPFGYYISGQRRASDLVEASFRLAGIFDSGQEMAKNFYAALPDGRTIFAVPPCPFFDRAGGTQSAGDTMEITFTSEECENLMEAAHRKSVEEAILYALRKAA